ncbi:MAG: DUF3343 domain-containing protein [Synergistales bacterium]|nr:DUF3343 domain-containing protein [Synergistales bacterium]
MQCLALFDTTHMALRFEKTCNREGFAARIVPVPRHLSASCGLACTYHCEREQEIRKLCETNDIEIAGFHREE